ncbi:dephospho-CoA kinase [Hydrocarboniclastica marina]|uniref:Dephospho-CoA kinase n=1 Tax=Hydrocarboniclastica marina TaxID=2259620 RepID=A0A4P7XJK2_9ALTE|nr:dephospho-CoA kinase [Hydrocarboniclastica marina]QCF26542.1 dephospho-CoA kinase [Hydrocarboniclastica marina]
MVGLTGGIGSGKSSVAEFFQKLGVKCVDADIVAREVVEPGEPALASVADYFGRSILNTDGSLDRAALRERIFMDPPAREWLEKCLHPVIRERMVSQLREAEGPYVLLVSPLLLETDQSKLCECIVVVDVPVDVQLKRTVDRDRNTPEQVERIIAAQMSRQERLARADEVIDNSRALAAVAEDVLALHHRLLSRFNVTQN